MGKEIHEPLTLEVMKSALNSIALVQSIRCHPNRHLFERDWLTKADEVIGYWSSCGTAEKLRRAIAAHEAE